MHHLQKGTTLQGGKYRIEKLLGQGGFGITYLAEQTMLKKKVAIKEFFIRDLCDRDETANVRTITQTDMVERYRQKFFKEAQILARLNHPGIVRVTDIFEENETVYNVMDYIEGESLEEIIKRNGPLSEPIALRYIFNVAEALEYIHQSNVNHLDIKPANIMIRQEDDIPILIDFGVSKQYDKQKDQTTTMPLGVSNGYSPLEQYEPGGVSTFSPQADIYALGATLYKLITGQTPPKAYELLNNGLPTMPDTFSPQVRKAIEKAMQPRKGDRLKIVFDFVEMLKGKNVINDENTFVLDKLRPNKESDEKIDKKIKGDEENKILQPDNKQTKFKITAFIKRHLLLLITVCCLLIAFLAFLFFHNSNVIVSFNGETIVLNKNKKRIIDHLLDNMVLVEGGTFTMGATSEQGDDAWEDEKPIHQVFLTSYSIGRYEVTQEEWEAVMDSNPSFFKGAKLPVENVSWDDCQEFIHRLNIITGKNFRLPTEAEWEYAARGGNKSKNFKYSGSNNLDEVAWYYKNSGDSLLILNEEDVDNVVILKEDYNLLDVNHCQTHPVGLKSPNELRLYDMSGNVAEMCYDWRDRYSSVKQTDPKGPSTGNDHISRGGGYDGRSIDCRVSCRSGIQSYDRQNDLGFRLVLSTITLSNDITVEEKLKKEKNNKIIIQNLINNMVYVEGGTYTMGATPEQGNDAETNEKPPHQVTLSSFHIGRYEVTQEEWRTVMGSNPSCSKGKEDKSPVDCVSWDECQEFVMRLSKLTNINFRLPTEAEWEFAARGGNCSQGYKFSGSNDVNQVVVDHDFIGSKAPNELGLYNMSGNVEEFCSDWYGVYSPSSQTNPKGPSFGSERVTRGGGSKVYDEDDDFRVTKREKTNPKDHIVNMGLRLAY